MDGGDRLGELRWEGDDVEATVGWTEGKPWEIGWGEIGWEGGSEMEATGWTEGETVGNSLGRAPLGGSDVLRSRAVGTGFSRQNSSIRLFRKTLHPRRAKVSEPWPMGHA